MKAIIAKLVWPAYFAGLLFLGYMGVNSYLDASSILKDHTVVEAPIELVGTSSRTKRGHTSTTYEFNYTYSVNGTDYVREHSAVNKKAERYLTNPTISIAYSNADPAMAGVLHVLEHKSSLGRWIKSMLIVALILGFLALLLWGWALPDDEEEELEEGATARS